jgi:AraC family transcriptional regulator of adaptative response / DNA-3-methyladenine glycosylase II
VAGGELSLDPGPAPEDTVRRLRQLPGVGEWTADYIAMRAGRWPDAFPHADLGLRKGIGEASARRILLLAEGWRPWRAYAAMHIWHSLNQVSQKEVVRA